MGTAQRGQGLERERDLHHRERLLGDRRAGADGVVYDTDRIMFLRSYLTQLQRATSEGVPVRGYFHWSLMDNFEWADGFAPVSGSSTSIMHPAAHAEAERIVLPGGRRAKPASVEIIAGGRWSSGMANPVAQRDLPLSEGNFPQRCRNLDVRLASCEMITDPGELTALARFRFLHRWIATRERNVKEQTTRAGRLATALPMGALRRPAGKRREATRALRTP